MLPGYERIYARLKKLHSQSDQNSELILKEDFVHPLKPFRGRQDRTYIERNIFNSQPGTQVRERLRSASLHFLA